MTISPSFNLYRMVVLPAAASPGQVSATHRRKPHRERSKKEMNRPLITTARADTAHTTPTSSSDVGRTSFSTICHSPIMPIRTHAAATSLPRIGRSSPSTHHAAGEEASARGGQDLFPPIPDLSLKKAKAGTLPPEDHPKHSAYRPVPPSGSASPSCQTGWQTPWTGTSPWWATVWGGLSPRAHTV